MDNFSLYGLPEEIKFCKKCVISNQRPSSVVEFKNTVDQKKEVPNLIKKESVKRVNTMRKKHQLIGKKGK